MIKLYEESELDKCRKLKKKLTIILYGIIAAGVFLTVLVFILKLQLPWGEDDTPYFWSNAIIASVFGIAILIYCAIPYRIAKSYFKLLKTVLSGKGDMRNGVFVVKEEAPVKRDGLEFNNLLFLEGADTRGREKIARVMQDGFKHIRDIKRGDLVNYIAIYNIITEYEIIKSGSITEAEIAQKIKRAELQLGINIKEQAAKDK